MPKLIQMDHRFKCKEEAVRLLEENVGKIYCNLRFLRYDTKSMVLSTDLFSSKLMTSL